MIFNIPKGFVFQLTVFGLAAVGIQYLGTLFNTSTRWALLIVLFVIVARHGELRQAYRSRILNAVAIYFLWIVCTILWSQIPILTVLKAGAYFLAVSALVAGGLYWVRICRTRSPISFLFPIVPLAIAAGLLGSRTNITLGGQQIDAGITGNPNYLGMLVALSVPWALYHTYVVFQNRSTTNWSKGVAIGILAILAEILYRSGSRSSLLCTLVVVLSFALAVFPRRIIPIVLVGSLIAIGSVFFLPSVTGGVYQAATQFLIKSGPENGAFFSRATVFQADYKGAMAGGMTGVGFGVDAGMANFTPGLTAQFYGRLKGNSQLGVIEGTGLIGFALYIYLLGRIFHVLIARARSFKDQNLKVQLSLCLGLMGGLLALSVFEAWWASPGSPEATAFWATVGVAMGIAKNRPRKIAPSKRPESASVRSGQRVLT